MKSYVLDTAVIGAALRSDTGASRELLEAARARTFELVLSVPLLLEYEAVLTRPEHAAEHRISTAGIAALVDELAFIGKKVILGIRTRPQLWDANDEMVLETALTGQADAIVTFNVRDFLRAAARFGLSVIKPSEALRELEAETK
jgi:putative PIN family toxin of toxin-antitoxin system